MKIKVAAVQLKPGTEPLFIGAPEVMRGLDRELRWADRPMTTVQVRRGTKLMRALDKGAEGLGLRVRESGSWERNTRPSQASYGLYFDGGGEAGEVVELDAILNSDGSAQWWYSPDVVTVGDVLAAREADVFLGNPHRLYVVVDEPPEGVGNGLDYWFELIRALAHVQEYAKAAADVAAPWVELGGIVLAARAAIQAVRSRWDDTGGDLNHYASLFKVARNTQQAATLLRIREEDVPAILHFLGLELTRDGYWRPSNKPERRELAELAAVADAAGHWSLRADSLREGLAEILALPPGQRRKQAEGILRRQAFEAAEQQEGKDEPYVARSESGRDDQFEVVKFDDGYDRILLDTIQLLPDGTCAVIDPDGRTVLNSSGSEMRFGGIDDAAEFIGRSYKKR